MTGVCLVVANTAWQFVHTHAEVYIITFACSLVHLLHTRTYMYEILS